MCFYFYFSLLHLKLIFCPLPKGENQLAQLESEGLVRWLSLPPGSVPPGFLWPMLAHGCAGWSKLSRRRQQIFL